MSNALDLLTRLQRAGIAIRADGNDIRCNAPPGVLTAAIVAELQANKTDLVEILRDLRSAAVADVKKIHKTPRDNILPLSFAQQRLWFIDQLESNQAVYNVPFAARLRGPLDAPVLERSLSEIVRRHEILRTTFPSVSGEAVQRIGTAQPVSLPVVDLSGTAEDDRDSEVRRRLTDEAGLPFDLSADQMLRTGLLRLGEEEHVFFLTLHHIAVDEWSLEVFFRELADLYGAFRDGQASPLADLPIQYADYAAWQREWLQGDVLEKQMAYWKEHLQDAPPLLNLPTDRPRPAVQTFRGLQQSAALDAGLVRALQELSVGEGVTLFMTLLAAFQTLLYRYSGQTDLVVGTPIANRDRGETEDLIGFFVNTLALRMDLSGNPTFRELLGRVREVVLGAFAHHDLPFEKLVAELKRERNVSYSPLFQVAFVYYSAAAHLVRLSGMTTETLEIDVATAKYDLTLIVALEDKGLRVCLKYNSDLFQPDTIARMLGHWQVMLEGIAANPKQRIGELPLLTEAESHRLLVDWNATAVDYAEPRCLHELFEAQVGRTPDAVAVVFEGQELTYRELNARSNQLAHFLRGLGVGPDVPVGICMQRSLEMIVALYGVHKAGGAYVPVDPEYPRQRLARMFDVSRMPVLLIQEHLHKVVPKFDGRIVCLDSLWDEIAREPEHAPPRQTRAQHLAYIIFTSGSTGEPKGVMVPHAGICNRLLWMQEAYGLDATDRVLQKTPFSFDVSVWEFFWPLQVGATIVVAKPGGHRDPEYQATLIEEERITTIHFVPSMLRVFLEGLQPGRCRSLRRVVCSGEALPHDLVERFFERTDAELHNLYGPTEASVDVTAWACTPDYPRQVVPIGKPIANTRVYVLDGHRQLVPDGIPGELYLGGIQVARGYLNRPELTAERFVPDCFINQPGARLYRTGDLVRWLPDGNLEFLGRQDHQVKIRGFRVELGEIESCLRRHPAIRDVVVLAREDSPGDQRLVAYVVAMDGETSVADLRSDLQQDLPEYMVPSAFMTLSALPLTPNGKLDLRALPAPGALRPELEHAYTAPRTRLEEILAGIWAEMLGLEHVGINDNFFDLGGHSLLAVRVTDRIQKAVRKPVPLATIFRAPTIAELAQHVESDRGHADNLLEPARPDGGRAVEQSAQGSLIALRDGPGRPLFLAPGATGGFLMYEHLVRHLDSQQPVCAFHHPETDGFREPFADLETMAAFYVDVMRNRQSQGPYFLGGFSFGGVLAFEMARQLNRLGHRVAILAIIDTGLLSPQQRTARRLLRSLSASLKNLPYWLADDLSQIPPREWLPRLGEELKHILWRIRHPFGAAETVAEVESRKEHSWVESLPDQVRELASAHLLALSKYRPGGYPGRVTLFRARTRELLTSGVQPDLCWGQYATGGVEVKVVSGNHFSVLSEPHVKSLARELQGSLREAEDGLG